MPRDAFLVKLDEWLACTGKNWRVVSDAEHDEIIDFLLKQADGSDTGSIGCKQRRWKETGSEGITFGSGEKVRDI